MNLKLKEKEVSPKKLKRRLLLSLIAGVLFFSFITLAYITISEDTGSDEASSVVRAFFHWNEKIFLALQSNSKLSVEKTKPPKGKIPRINGNEGLDSKINLKNYRVEIISGLQKLDLPWNDFKTLPPVEVTTDFKCIEGWSEVIHYKGLRFSDFMNHYKLGKKADGSYYKFVALETPDQKYYVSIDMKSMLHPQTVIAYEMNEAPLSIQNGAPLRLIIPIKYGIKSLKRIGRIYFSDEQPKDFWTEQGYDWFAGL